MSLTKIAGSGFGAESVSQRYRHLFCTKQFLLTTWRSLTKIAGSGSASGSSYGSISQRYGSADPDPCQNFMDPQQQHWCVCTVQGSSTGSSSRVCSPPVTCPSSSSFPTLVVTSSTSTPPPPTLLAPFSHHHHHSLFAVHQQQQQFLHHHAFNSNHNHHHQQHHRLHHLQQQPGAGQLPPYPTDRLVARTYVVGWSRKRILAISRNTK